MYYIGEIFAEIIMEVKINTTHFEISLKLTSLD